jgi:pullulanase
MAAVLFTSLGVPMLAEGQDFLRSKRGISNTYQLGDVNALDYNRRYVFSGTHGYFRDWIHFRSSDAGRPLRFDGGLTVGYLEFFFTQGSSAVIMLINADNSRPGGQLVFGLNPHLEYANIDCPTVTARSLKQIVDQERFDLDGLKSALIPLTDHSIHLPPLSCGLWQVVE